MRFSCTDLVFVSEFLIQLVKKILYFFIQPSRLLPTLFGHTCTLIGDEVYIVGGYSGIDDALNEFVLKLNLITFTWGYLKVTGSGLAGKSDKNFKMFMFIKGVCDTVFDMIFFR